MHPDSASSTKLFYHANPPLAEAVKEHLYRHLLYRHDATTTADSLVDFGVAASLVAPVSSQFLTL